MRGAKFCVLSFLLFSGRIIISLLPLFLSLSLSAFYFFGGDESHPISWHTHTHTHTDTALEDSTKKHFYSNWGLVFPLPTAMTRGWYAGVSFLLNHTTGDSNNELVYNNKQNTIIAIVENIF